MLYLASASPRRSELLTQIGVRFIQAAVDIDETPRAGEGARCYVERLALEKASECLQQITTKGHTSASAAEVNDPQAEIVVLGSDTSVIINDDILGKPQDSDAAYAMLKRLSGQRHQVFSAVAVISKQQTKVISVATDVVFRPLSEQQIQDYIATGEPMDKAGSYGIQGLGAILVDRIEGSYSNVVGLPLTETAELLKTFKIAVWQPC